MDQLPLVILLQIAEDSVETWKSLVFAHPRVGRWSLQPEYQKYIQRRYTKCIKYLPNEEEEDEVIIRGYKLCSKWHYMDDAVIEYKLCGKWHNVDDAAIEYKNGTKEWYKHGLLHREGDLPSIEDSNGTKEWYKHGLKHRDGDLPAVIHPNGTKCWYWNDKYHRDGDLPATECFGTKCWFKNGKRHRDGDLPAIEKLDGTKEWFKNGVYYIPIVK